MAKRYVLGIDIGGTKVSAMTYEITPGGLAEDHNWLLAGPARKGVRENTQQMANIIDEAYRQAQANRGRLEMVGIGTAGRFRNGRIIPGTNENMGRPGEFDGQNLEQNYLRELKHLPAPPAVIVANDAEAMLAGMLEMIRDDKADNLTDQDGTVLRAEAMHNRHVALLGIGTGIGHAIAKVGRDGHFSIVTDGHACKLRVKVDDEDLPKLEILKKARGQSNVLFFPEDNTIRAEDLFCGPAVNALAGISQERVEFNAHNSEHAEAVKFAGKYMARLIKVINDGNPRDVVPENEWSSADKREAAKTSLYLIGGGMGQSPFGAEIIREAARELEKLGLSDIKLVQYKGRNVAARGAATMALEALGQQRSAAIG